MKKSKLLFGIICAALLLPFSNVSADSTYVNVDKTTNYTVTVKQKGQALFDTYINEAVVEKNDLKTFYYAAFTEGNRPAIPVDSDGYCNVKDNGSDIDNWVVLMEDGAAVLSDWYMIKGYQQVYVVKKTEVAGTTAKYQCTYSEKPVFVTKPTAGSLGTRYNTYLFDKNSEKKSFEIASFAKDIPRFLSDVDHIVTDTNRYVHIGKITDKNLTYNLTRNKEGALKDLLTYAQNDKDAKEFTFAPDVEKLSDSEFEVDNGSYYYIYTFYKDAKVRDDLYDIVFTEAKESKIEKYEDYIPEEPTTPNKKDKVKNPKTGVEDYILPTLLVVSFLVLINLLAKRKDLFRNI